MLLIRSLTPNGPRSFAIVVCRAGEESERGRQVARSDHDYSFSFSPEIDEIEIYDYRQRGGPGMHPQLGDFFVSYPLEDVAGFGRWAWDAGDGQPKALLPFYEDLYLDADAKQELITFAARVFDRPVN